MAITLSSITANEIYGVRSPLPLAFSAGGLGEFLKTITVDLKIWIGDKTTNKPSTATYSISLGTNTLGTTLQYYEVDIAELVREYIDTDALSVPSNYGSDWAAWVEIDWNATSNLDGNFSGSPTIICTNGYRAYEDPTLTLDTYYFPTEVKVPSEFPYFITVLDKGVTGASRVIDTIEIDYDSSPTETTSFGTAGTTTSSLFKVATLEWFAGDTQATINLKLGSDVVHSFVVKRICKSKYDNIMVGYVNRVGVIDYQYFFGKNEKNQTVNRQTYKPALDNRYNTANSQYRIMTANGKLPFTTNSDWVTEPTKEKIRDLILTEYAFDTGVDVTSFNNLGDVMSVILQEDGGTILSESCLDVLAAQVEEGLKYYRYETSPKAINPTDSEQVMKQDNNELSNYTLSFEYAYDYINSVR